MALLPTIGPYLLPRVAREIHKALPRLELQLYEYQTSTMLEKLNAGQLDLGILALPVNMDGLEARQLYEEPFALAVPAQHRLAQKKEVTVDDLKDETLLLLEDGHCLRDQALDVCSGVGVQEKQDFRATSLETLRQMVATGAGVTLLPELASRGDYGTLRDVVMRPFAEPRPHRYVGAIWRKTTARRPAIDAVCALIEKARAVGHNFAPLAPESRSCRMFCAGLCLLRWPLRSRLRPALAPAQTVTLVVQNAWVRKPAAGARAGGRVFHTEETRRRERCSSSV
ncbi:MAG: LysR substrate-binding domain-containing protein [Gammaproteobacteria bacterium]